MQAGASLRLLLPSWCADPDVMSCDKLGKPCESTGSFCKALFAIDCTLHMSSCIVMFPTAMLALARGWQIAAASQNLLEADMQTYVCPGSNTYKL